MTRTIKVGLGALTALILALGLTSCAQEDRALSVPQSFCGFIQGNGGLDRDRNVNSADVKEVLYQGQTARFQSDEDTGYVFPCVTRNYVIAPEGVSADANRYVAGRTKVTEGKGGTPVGAWITAYWQPNQQKEPIRAFIGFAQGKYGAAATDPAAFNGNNAQNASTPGWNKMLAENMYPVLQRIFEQSVATVDDSIWQNKDVALRDQVGAEMTNRFAAAFQQTTGSVDDLICGSGSSGVGEQFNCEPVRIVVDDVFATQGNMQQDAAIAAEREAKLTLDQQTKVADINLTNEKYGPLAPAFRTCRDLNAAQPGSCKFIVGPGGAQIPVP